MGLIRGLSILSDSTENTGAVDFWNNSLVTLLRDTQNWIESTWTKSGSTTKTRTLCRLLISSLEIIPFSHTSELLKWIRGAVVSRRDYVSLSIQDSLQKEDQMNNGRRPWLVYQFKALL